MTHSRRPLVSLICFSVWLFGVVWMAGAETVALKYKTYRNWDVVLPKESFVRVSGDFAFPDSSPSTFATELDGAALRIDRNADGELEAVVEGKAGLVTLVGKTHAGDRFLYALRLIKTNAGWGYAASGAALGMIDGQKVRIIDQNNNGRYDDYGEDAIVIGQGRYASYLSKVINVRGKLYSIDVAADGLSLGFEPFVGEVGTLDLSSQFATNGKLLSVVVRSADGDHSFNLAGGAMAVPAGRYELDQGKIGVGRNLVTFTKGKLGTIEVEAGVERVLALGDPVHIQFEYALQGGKVILDPRLVNYVGRGGEAYQVWKPFGGSPQFDVRDIETGEQIALAVFGGT